MNIEETIHFLETSKDLNAMRKAFTRMSNIAEEKDLPILLEAMQSRLFGFGVREWLAEPVIRLLGPRATRNLMKVLHMNFEEGHDNDSLQGLLINLAEKYPNEVREELNNLRDGATIDQVDDIKWLIEFC